MARKVMTLKQIADAYGVDYRTFQKNMNQQENIYDELDDAGFDGRKFYPNHKKIIEDYFGNMPTNKKQKK